MKKQDVLDTQVSTNGNSFESLPDDFELSTSRAFDFAVWYLGKIGKPAWSSKNTLLYHTREGNITAQGPWPYEYKVANIKALCDWLPAQRYGKPVKALDRAYVDMGRLPDTTLAEKHGVAVRTMSRRRQSLMIPAFKVGVIPDPAIRYQDDAGKTWLVVKYPGIVNDTLAAWVAIHTDTLAIVETFAEGDVARHITELELAKIVLTGALESGQILTPSNLDGVGLELVTPVETMHAMIKHFDVLESTWAEFYESRGAEHAVKRAGALVAKRHPVFDITNKETRLEIMHEVRAINPSFDWVNLTTIRNVYGLPDSTD